MVAYQSPKLFVRVRVLPPVHDGFIVKRISRNATDVEFWVRVLMKLHNTVSCPRGEEELCKSFHIGSNPILTSTW